MSTDPVTTTDDTTTGDDDATAGVSFSEDSFVRPTVRPQTPQPRESASSLVAARYLRDDSTTGTPARRLAHKLSGGLVPVESESQKAMRALTARIGANLQGGHHRTAVLSIKGGVGKTTTAAVLGAGLASLRGDRVVAVDANPDMGTLARRVRLETDRTIRDLLNESAQIRRYADIRAFTNRNKERLEVIASESDPEKSVQYNADDHRRVSELLEQHYNVVITDCGTGILHSAMGAVLELADQVVIVINPALDTAYLGSSTIDWLEKHGYEHLVKSGMVAITNVTDDARKRFDLASLREHFETKARAVVEIPWDEHLSSGAEISLDRLAKPTRWAVMEAAAELVDGFAMKDAGWL